MKQTLKSVLTAMIGLTAAAALIYATVVLLRKYFAPAVSRANAEMVFRIFSTTAQRPDVTIRDSQLAVEIATEGFRKTTDSPPLDGWAHAMKVTAIVEGESCAMSIQSAGPDAEFDTDDDIVFKQTFDLSIKVKQPLTGVPPAGPATH